jgi:Ca2+-binding RTX toxin-like protein
MSRPLIEGLESRQLLSATLVNGVLTVTGTAGPDRIELERKSDRLRLRENGRDRTFSYAAVQSIVVNALASGDRIELEHDGSEAVNKPSTLNGGDGSDRIEGGPNVDTVSGGAGNDEIRGRGGNDVLSGDAGNDRIDGDAGNDLLSGGDGDDDLEGASGFDRITGGLGNDDFDDQDAAAEIVDRTAADAGSNNT